ncbi:hypothetical protein BpHYR1_007032 [Brachionus plicatilis]|uniref:Uncharacterized protein n=1 Tax=Brachionus plicatilis TaxID=10195 RepID=A0A3M7RZJ9_BRAPC|nr:hypothetical protein BpHYR1_007032 [Brachionus plicatilis]
MKKVETDEIFKGQVEKGINAIFVKKLIKIRNCFEKIPADFKNRQTLKILFIELLTEKEYIPQIND